MKKFLMKLKQFTSEIILLVQYPLLLYIGHHWFHVDQTALGPLEVMHLAPILSCVLSRAMITTKKKVLGQAGLLVYLFFLLFLVSFSVIRPPWATAADIGQPPDVLLNLPQYVCVLVLAFISVVLQLLRIRCIDYQNGNTE